MKKLKSRMGKNFVAIMIAIACFALLLRLAVMNTIAWNILQNESVAASTLKLISASLENYAKNHLASYPPDITALTKTIPPYLDESYNLPFVLKGYSYSCLRLTSSGYSCWAVPQKCGLTGKKTYNISTGGVFVTEKCTRNDQSFKE